MKTKHLLSLSFLLLIGLTAKAQDQLIKLNGDTLKVKIKEVRTHDIVYKHLANPEGPDFIQDKSEISYLIFENGVKVTVSPAVVNTSGAPVASAKGKYTARNYTPLTNEERTNFMEGQKDAMKYYHADKCGSNGILITAAFSPFISVIPAFAIANTPPSELNLNYPDYAKMQNQDYRMGYFKTAHKIKKRKIWKNCGIGASISIVTYIFLLSL